jgi:hypothetical protein
VASLPAGGRFFLWLHTTSSQTPFRGGADLHPGSVTPRSSDVQIIKQLPGFLFDGSAIISERRGSDDFGNAFTEI